MAVKCPYCGDRGKEDGCPKCGKDIKKIVVPEKQKEYFIRKAEYALIPEEYIGKAWSKQLIIDSHPELDKDLLFKTFVDRLDKMHEAYRSGILPRKSAIIQAPARMSKEIFAYSCMQMCMNRGITVAPIIDTLDLKRLIVLSAENPNYRIYNIDYDRYINSTVCFVSVTSTDRFSDALPVIRSLMSKRARLGLPTIILSRYGLKDLCQDSFDQDYESLVEQSASANRLKYPVIISYSNRK